MKNYFAVMLALIMLFISFTSCGDENYLADSKFNTNHYLAAYDSYNIYSCICETVSCWFAIGDSITRFDKTTEKISQLIDVDKNAGTISVYDGRLYWLERESEDINLCSVDENGLDLRIDRQLSLPEAIGEVCFSLHRGYIYYWYVSKTSDTGYVVKALCELLDGYEVVEVLEKQYDNKVNVILQFKANSIYLSIINKDVVNVYLWNSKARQLSCIFNNKLECSAKSVWIKNKSTIYLADKKAAVYKLNTRSQRIKKLFDFSDYISSAFIDDVVLSDGCAFVISRMGDGYFSTDSVGDSYFVTVKKINSKGKLLVNQRIDLPQALPYLRQGASAFSSRSAVIKYENENYYVAVNISDNKKITVWK